MAPGALPGVPQADPQEAGLPQVAVAEVVCSRDCVHDIHTVPPAALRAAVWGHQVVTRSTMYPLAVVVRPAVAGVPAAAAVAGRSDDCFRGSTHASTAAVADLRAEAAAVLPVEAAVDRRAAALAQWLTEPLPRPLPSR